MFTRKKGYFAASNGGRGFKNYYREVFGGADCIYVVKGGPGTGKSRFMREVAEYAEARGWGAEYYLCSSDAESTDGVLLSRGGEVTAIIDGTPPHAWEPELPGVREEIVNLGVFWSARVLRESRDDICRLIRRRADLWRLAYRWLSGCLDMCDVIKTIGADCLRYGEVSGAADAILDRLPDGKGGGVRLALQNSVGMGGVVSSGEYINRAEDLYIIRDSYMTAHILIKELLEAAKSKQLDVIISYDPIDADRADAIFIEDCNLAVVVTDKTPDREYTAVNMSSFLTQPDEKKAELAQHAELCSEAMLSGAVDTLSEIKECHFRLEGIYCASMDFPAKEAFTKEFCIKHFGE